MNKIKYIVITSIIAIMAIGCKPSISGYVTEVDSYGSVHTSFTIEEMIEEGFDYADLIKVEFDSAGTYIMPITTAYSEVGIGKPSYCHYSKRGEASFGYCQGDFHRIIGGNPGEKVKISLYKKRGYKNIYDKVQAIYSTDRTEYPSDEVFANFREIKTTGIKPKTVYRSGNPLNFKSNPNRCYYVDSLAYEMGIQTEIDIADTDDDIVKYSEDESFKGVYCLNLFINGQTVALGMGSDTFCERAYAGFAEGMRFIINNNGPYLIHCNEGKDRCGFYCILLESLAGASIEELENDYMTTYTNLYKIKPGSESYELNKKMCADRLIWLMSSPEDISNPDFDWNTIDLDSVDPYNAAFNFLTQYCNMSSDEVSILIDKISE